MVGDRFLFKFLISRERAKVQINPEIKETFRKNMIKFGYFCAKTTQNVLHNNDFSK